jgi:hypothetical protein
MPLVGFTLRITRRGFDMNRHVVIVLTRRGETWRRHCPDFPGLRAEGASAEQLFIEATQSIRRTVMLLRHSGAPLPRIRTYAEVRTDDVWSRQEGIRWSNAIVRLVSLPPDLQPIANPAETSTVGHAQTSGKHSAVA